MDLDMIALVKDSQANKTSIITRLVMEQQGNLLVHKEAPAQGGQVKVNTLETLFSGFHNLNKIEICWITVLIILTILFHSRSSILGQFSTWHHSTMGIRL